MITKTCSCGKKFRTSTTLTPRCRECQIEYLRGRTVEILTPTGFVKVEQQAEEG